MNPTPEKIAAAIANSRSREDALATARRYRAWSLDNPRAHRQFQQHLKSVAEKMREDFINFIRSRVTEEQVEP